MKRIVLLATAGVVLAAVLAASGLSVARNAQKQTAGQAAEDVCAPWFKAWDVSEGYS